MSKGYLRSLLQYLSSVYNIGGKKLKDKRINPKITTSSIAFTLLIGFMLKIRSFNQLDDWLEHDDFRRIVPGKMRLPRIDAIRDSLKVIEIKDLGVFHHSIIGVSIKNKIVRNGTIDGYKVVAFDSVELFKSTKKSCENCLTRVINKTSPYYHRCVVAAYIGKDPHLVLGQEMLHPKTDRSNKDEGEMTAAKRLIQNLHSQLCHFADVVAAPLRYVKFLKKITNTQTNKSKYSQVCIITTSQTITLETLFKIIKARWNIENNVFRQLKIQWHMGHCFIHD